MIDVILEYLDLAQALLTLVILSLILERSFTILFEYRWYEKFLTGKGVKTPIAFLTAWVICLNFQ